MLYVRGQQLMSNERLDDATLRSNCSGARQSSIPVSRGVIWRSAKRSGDRRHRGTKPAGSCSRK